MYWIPKMHKNPISFLFIIASPVCSIKPLSKDITSIFKLFYEKVERYHTKGRLWSGVKTFWTIQNSYPVISSINKLNKCKAAKSVSTFDFSMLNNKIPHDKLMYVLNEVTDFAFKGGTSVFLYQILNCYSKLFGIMIVSIVTIIILLLLLLFTYI